MSSFCGDQMVSELSRSGAIFRCFTFEICPFNLIFLSPWISLCVFDSDLSFSCSTEIHFRATVTFILTEISRITNSTLGENEQTTVVRRSLCRVVLHLVYPSCALHCCVSTLTTNLSAVHLLKNALRQTAENRW